MKIRIAPGALLLLFVAALTEGILFPAALLSVAVHECGHYLAAKALGVRLRLLELDVAGAKFVPAGAFPSYRAEGLLAAAGPAASLLLALLTLPHGGALATATRTVTLSLALFNLLPVKNFDGGRILNACLSHFIGNDGAERVLSVTSYLSLLALFALSSCVLLRYGQNLSLAVLSASLFARLFLTGIGKSTKTRISEHLRE